MVFPVRCGGTGLQPRPAAEIQPAMSPIGGAENELALILTITSVFVYIPNQLYL